MTSPAQESRGALGGRREWPLLLAGALVALVPYFLNRDLFARLFWFGDELDLIDQFDRIGFWHWVWLVFAENFVPLFKVLWGGAVFAFGGSYGAMILLVWLTHALNVALLGRVMRACGLSWTAVFTAQVLFGLTPGNYETLGWSVQGSAVLAVTFLLLGLDALLRSRSGREQVAWAASSALSFSRGVLTGPVIALGVLMGADGGKEQGKSRWRRAAWLLVPAVGVASLITLLASGNHQHLKGHEAQAAVFGLWYYCANPAHYLLSVEPYGWHTVVLLGSLKVALVVWALARSEGRTRALFLMLVAFEVGNSGLLGVGRYHTGLGATLSPRYLYASLIGIAPILGFAASRLRDALPGPAGLRLALAALALAAVAGVMVRDWAPQIEPFTAWRGTESRRILFEDPAPAPDAVPGIPGLPMSRAKALIRKYHLH